MVWVEPKASGNKTKANETITLAKQDVLCIQRMLCY